MKEDILSGRYSDPMILDDYALERVKDFENNVQELAGHILKEEAQKPEYYRGYDDYQFRKRKNLQKDEEETTEDKNPYFTGKNRRIVKHDHEPWVDDQAVEWPDYEAEAFEKALGQFRQRPESNTGYKNKALNDRMIKKYGQQAKKCIDDTLFDR